MTTQSVMTQAAKMFGNSAGSLAVNGSTTVKGKQSGSGFNMFIDSNMKTTQKAPGNSNASVAKKTSVQTSDTVNSVKKDDTDEAEIQTNSAATDPFSKAETTKADTSKAADQKDLQSDDTKINVSKEDEQNSESDEVTVNIEDIAEIIGMLQSIQEAVMKTLNLSPEEFNQLLTDQGMNLTDLIQPENLQQFVLAGSGQKDILALLTDENLADTMKQVLQAVDEIVDQSKLALTGEQLKSILSQAEAQTDTQANTTNEQVAMPIVEPKDESKEQPQAEVINSTQSEVNDNKNNAKSVTNKNATSEIAKPVVDTASDAGKQSGTDNGTSDDLNTSNQFQTFIENLVKATANPQADFTGEMAQAAQLRNIANQIIDRIKVSVTSDQTSMELQLNPENLGKVNLSVETKNGAMTAHFVVQNEISKEAIESQMQTLRDTLNQQGIKVDSIEVTVSANAFEQTNQESSNNEAETKKNNSGRKITLDDAVNMTEDETSESNTQDVTGVRGSMVDYTA